MFGSWYQFRRLCIGFRSGSRQIEDHESITVVVVVVVFLVTASIARGPSVWCLELRQEDTDRILILWNRKL